MKRDEYNVEKINNEENSLSFEFGSTQDEDFTSYPDNRTSIRDEVNDNPTSNETKRPKKEEKRRKKEESNKKESNQSSSPESTISSSTATISTVVGASLVSVVTLSTIVGINLFFNGKCNMNMVETSSNSIFYELDLTDINDDKCVIKLEHLSYSETQELEEGLNSGEFIDLIPSTEYHVSVVDVTYNNYILFEDDVSTKEEYIPPVETYTVTFNSNGGSIVESQVVNAGEKVSKPADPVRDNYTFEGWYSDSELTEEYNFDDPVNSDITLYASWKEVVIEYCTITFDANGGEGAMDPIQVEKGSTYTLPETWDFTPPNGRIFNPYFWLVNGVRQSKAVPITVTGDLVIANDWDFAAMIYFDANGGTGEMEPTRTSGDFTFPECEFTPPEDKEFDYWTFSNNSGPTYLEFQPGQSTSFEPSNEGEIKEYIISPVWKDIYTYYTVTFNSNGGTEVASQTIKEGETVTKPDDPTMGNYAFKGWFSNSTLTEEYDFSTPVESNLELYAKWEIITYTVSFDANGGEGEQESGIGNLGEEYILPECTFTAPSGKIFDCWQLSGTEKTYESGDGYLAESDEDVTFIAVWAEAATIEFYPNGAEGSVISKKIAVGKEYTIPSGDDLFTAPTDKEFDYWFDDMESEQRYAGDVITITDTYYSFTARWKYLEGITYTVTFDSNGGSEVDPQVVNAGTNATKPTDPTKENYTFKGWYSNSTLTTSYSFLLPVTEDITLYAKWELTTYLVAFDSNGGSEVDSQDVVIGETATVPDEPTREDCTFEGWFTDSELTEEYDFDTPVTANIELFAKWSATYSVSGEGFTVFPHTSSETTEYSEVEDRVREINGVSLQIGIYSCYIDDEEHGRGMWIQPCNYGQGYDPQNPPESPVPQETDMGFMANSTPINGFIKSIAITVGPDRYNNGDSNAKLHVLFGTSAMLELTYTGGTTKTYGDSATEVFMAPEGCLYFNISNLSGEEGLTIESIVITYYVNN